jgi:serine protease Do
MIPIKQLTYRLLAICTPLSVVAADLPPPGDDHHSGDRIFERRTLVGPGEHEKETVTFLGVETAPVSPTLSAQLQLPNGAGLIVAQVVPNSPAASALQTHDILLKLDDQLLIDSRQLSVLVRNHAEGDSVTLTYVRAGKHGTSAVKLVKREVPKMVFFRSGDSSDLPPLFAGRDDDIAGRREDTDHVLRLVGPGPQKQTRRLQGKPGPDIGYRGTKVNTANSNMVYTDPQGSLELTIKDGQKTIVAKNEKGEQVFSGPVTSPEERKALPPELRERLERIEAMDEFSFETDDAFEDHLRIMRPGRRQIRLDSHEAPQDLPRSSVL